MSGHEVPPVKCLHGYKATLVEGDGWIEAYANCVVCPPTKLLTRYQPGGGSAKVVEEPLRTYPPCEKTKGCICRAGHTAPCLQTVAAPKVPETVDAVRRVCAVCGKPFGELTVTVPVAGDPTKLRHADGNPDCRM